MKPTRAMLFAFVGLIAAQIYSAQGTTPAAQEKGREMKFSHVHLGVKDLPAALKWLDAVWQTRPTFQNERMASLPFGEFTIILDATTSDTPATVGFDSQNCDADVRAARARGAVVLEDPTDRPWGVRSAYIQGPGGLKFEIEQPLPRRPQ